MQSTLHETGRYKAVDPTDTIHRIGFCDSADSRVCSACIRVHQNAISKLCPFVGTIAFISR